jgi:predicted HTH domain antitoxin
MVKLSVSKVARMLGLKRGEVQEQINTGKLHTHEGYVTTDSVRLAYPEFSISCEQDNRIEKANKIKEYADRKMSESKAIHNENEQKLLKIIAELKEEIRVLKLR